MFRNVLIGGIRKSAGVALSQQVIEYANSLGVLDALMEYCNANKAVVEYINDWKYLIHSLVDCGAENYLVSNDNAYLDMGLDYYGQVNNISFGFKYKDLVPTHLVGMFGALNAYGYGNMVTSDHVGGWYGHYGNSAWRTSFGLIVDAPRSALIEFKNGQYSINGNSVGDGFTATNTWNMTGEKWHWWLYNINPSNRNGATPCALSCPFKVAYFYQDKVKTSYSNEEHHKLVPYYNGEECGMLDLWDCSFHGNINSSGSFSIEMT